MSNQSKKADTLGASMRWFGPLVSSVFASVFLVSLSILPVGAATGGVLHITVQNIESSNGFLNVNLYDSEEAFLEEPVERISVPAEEGETVITISGLPEGQYAFSIYHDDDSDGKLDRGFLGIPKEGVGFSNDASFRTGPPDHDEAVIEVDDGEVVETTVSLNY